MAEYRYTTTDRREYALTTKVAIDNQKRAALTTPLKPRTNEEFGQAFMDAMLDQAADAIDTQRKTAEDTAVLQDFTQAPPEKRVLIKEAIEAILKGDDVVKK